MDVGAACQADNGFPRDVSKRLAFIDIGSCSRVEKLWEKALIGWIDSTFRTSDQSHIAQAATAFALACGVVCRGHNGNQLASVIHGGLEQRGLSPLRAPNPLLHSSCAKECKPYGRCSCI